MKVQAKEGFAPKGYRPRVIPLNDEALRALQEVPRRGRYVVTNPDGSRVTTLKRSFQTAARRAGASDVSLNTLRHTFASWLVMAGVDLPSVQKLMGHARVTTTMVYAHLAPDHLRAAVSRLSPFCNHPP